MLPDERRAWLDHQRDRWNAWTAALSRIKQDEQRWILAATAVYGALVAFLGAHGTDLFPAWPPGRPAEPWQWRHLVALLVVLVVAHLFGWVWARHALTLRVQYYRTMARQLDVGLALGESLPPAWYARDPSQWRTEVTRPDESKDSEMWLLAFLTFAPGLLAVLQAARGLASLAVEQPALLWVASAAVALALLVGPLWWPCGFYRTRDRRNMKQLYCERVRKLQCKGKRRAKGESVGSDE